MEVRILIYMLELAICATAVHGSYQFVIAPNVIRLNHEEVVTATFLGGERNVRFTIWFELGGKRISEKTVDVQSQEQPATTTMRIRSEDIEEQENPLKKRNKPTEVILRASSQFGHVSRPIKLSYRTGYLIVQTDKPLYTPRENVNVRVLAMDESLKPVKDIPVTIDIVDPENKVVARKTFKNSESGFSKTELELPPFPDSGIWTAKASFGGKFDTVGTSPFEVKEFVLPTYGVTITLDEADSYILKETKTIKVKVDAEYVYGKDVDGTAGLKVYINDKKNPDPESREYVYTLPRLPLANGECFFEVDIVQLLEMYDKPFPTGKYMEVEADVFESVTGKTETALDDSVIFADSPYYFSFTRSKRTYRPGVTYKLRVDMLYANGRPATDTEFKVKPGNGKEVIKRTDNKGEAIVDIETSVDNAQDISIQVRSNNGQDRATWKVEPYRGNNQIQVEKVITDDKKTEIRANTNINKNGQYTGILFMVVLRGSVVFTAYKSAAIMASQRLPDDLLAYVSPGARVIGFYVDMTSGTLVADAVKFQVDPRCQGEQLVVTPETPIIKPGDKVMISVTGPSRAWVGFNVLDDALLLLNSEHILKHNTVFKELEKHDLGCGVGGGRTSGEVFETTGLAVVTNAKFDQAPDHISEECTTVKNRWKRSNECPYGANFTCCEKGRKIASRIVEDYFDGVTEDMPVPVVDCYAAAKKISRDTIDELKMRCIIALYETCVHAMSSALDMTDEASGRSVLGGGNAYAEDMAKLYKLGFRPSARTKFETSFFFDEQPLNDKGRFSKELKFQDSITDWTIQALSISENSGACVAEDATVRTFKDFFVQLDLPYKATRFEHFDVKATIFNYNQEKNVHVYLQGVNGLCYGSKPGQPTDATVLTLPANSAQTVRFPMVPLKAGDLSVTLSALVTDKGSAVTDIVEKRLHVVNEGEQVEMNIQVCLDPNNQMKDCENDPRAVAKAPIHNGRIATRITEVDLTVPGDYITGTATATAYIETSAMDTVIKAVINGVDSLFQEPNHCGEQTMIYTAPIVYGMYYLRQTGQVTADNEVTGTKWIKKGIDRERIEFQKADGSYAAWKDRPTSMWLTAFVAKVFCQASEVTEGVVDQNSVMRTLTYITNNIQNDGSFIDNEPVIHTEMQGRLASLDRSKDPTLTSFVLITLQECKQRSPAIERAIQDAMDYLSLLPKKLYTDNPYFLAITAYALALSNSPRKHEFRNWLMQIKQTSGEQIYWRNSDSGSKGRFDVETTSYALLAILQFDDIRTSEGIVRWLTTQRKSSGMFYSTQDTVVALQALAIYSYRSYDADVNFDVQLTKEGTNWNEIHTVTKENVEYQKIIRDIPIENVGPKLLVTVTGSGYGRMNIDMRYNRPAHEDDKCPFNVNVEMPSDVQKVNVGLQEGRQCDVCGKCNDPVNPDYEVLVDDNEGNVRRKRQGENNDNPAAVRQKCFRLKVSNKVADKVTGMSIVKVQLETGVKVEKDDLDKLLGPDSNIARYEMPSSGRGYVILYLHKITKEETNIIFRLNDEFEGDLNSRQTATVRVYDYYNPEETCKAFYSVGPNHGRKSVDFKCDDKSKECECVQSTCSPPVEREIVDRVKETIRMKKLGRNIETAFEQLYKYACRPDLANYVVKVKITATNYDDELGIKIANGEVVKQINQGNKNFDESDEMTFVWQRNCLHPNIEKGKTYVIIGRDSTIAGQDERYSLMGTTLVIDLEHPDFGPREQSYIRTVARKLEEKFEEMGGCAN